MTESNALGIEIQSDNDSEADRLEQATPVYDDPADDLPSDVPLEADPADTYDQNREVPADDDYPHE
ncbi:hypothetical protein [Rhodococcus gordoniae]